MSYYGDSGVRCKMNDLKYEVEEFLDKVGEELTKEDAVVKLMVVVKDSIGCFLYDDLKDNDFY